MKILLSGYHNPHFFTITEYIERAIISLGHELIVFNDRDHIIPGLFRRQFKIFNKLSLDVINRNFVNLARRTRPDLIIVMGGNRITSLSLKRLFKDRFFTVLWTTDPPAHFQPILNSVPLYNYVFCQGTEAIELLDNAGIANAHWLPMACDSAQHCSLKLSEEEQKKYHYDIVFVGSYYPLRAETFEKLAEFDFGIWGPGWDRLAKGSCLSAHIQGAHTESADWVKIYGTSKIVIATHYQDPEGKFPVHQASPRIFEAMACGGFVVSDNQKDVFKLFKNGVHLVGYKGHEDLIAKIKFYLSHPAERRKIAEKGRQEVLRKHQYVHRIEKLLSIVETY